MRRMESCTWKSDRGQMEIIMERRASRNGLYESGDKGRTWEYVKEVAAER